MSSSASGLLIFFIVFGTALFAIWIRSVLPEHHLNNDTKDTVKITMGLVATLTALVLGLLVSSAKGSYDDESQEMTHMAAKIVFLDRVLAHYGPEAAETRKLLHHAVDVMVERLWPSSKSEIAQLEPAILGGDALYDAIQNLSPHNEEQVALKSQALATGIEIGQMRWLMFEQSGSSISTPMLIIVVCWLAILFFSFGLFAPGNGTAIVTLAVAALSVSGAIYLILELDRPFDGFIRISSGPMHAALAHIGN